MQEYVGAFDMKTHLSEYLQQVKMGSEFVITHRGVPIAKLSPLETHDKVKARKAADALLVVAKECNMGKFNPQEWRDYKDEGRPS